ncbi:ZIP family metal transporter, partial [Pseudomonadota bacterium]
KLFRIGLFTCLVMALHNFPEGLSTFSSAVLSPALGLSIAIAIAIHNIPEGIAVSLPIYYSTGSKKKAIFYSFISGMSEPVGGIVGYLFVEAFLNDIAFGVLLAVTAGFMVYISFDELLPAARDYGKQHLSIMGLITGMFVMALSLNLLDFVY